MNLRLSSFMIWRAARSSLIFSVLALVGCPQGSSSSVAPPAESSKEVPSLARAMPPAAARCAALKGAYEASLKGADRCERDDECALEERGKLFTGLDGCERATNARFDMRGADSAAAAWLDAGCASTYALCPSLTTKARCASGICRERPASPVPADWVRVDMDEAITVYLPPELEEVPYQRTCGNGPAQRIFEGGGLSLRIEYGYELSSLPLDDHPDDGQPYPPHGVTREAKRVGPHHGIFLTYEVPEIGNKSTNPDGTWPRFHWVRALSVRDIDAPMRSGFLDLGQGSGPVALAIIVEGANTSKEVVGRIFDSVTFW